MIRDREDGLRRERYDQAAMSAQDPLVRRDDLARAREIARKHAPFVGGDMLLESVAKAIAEGIADGRERAVSNRAPG